jgi:hypothetical protein
MLQIVNAFCVLIALIVGIGAYIFKLAGCTYSIIAVVIYLMAEVTVDAYLLSLVCITTQGSKLYKSLWITGFLLFDVVPRTIAFFAITFENKGFCNISSNPVLGFTANISLSLFAIAMGVCLAYNLISSQTTILTTVGVKSAIFCIILVLVKLVFYVPYVLQTIGPFSVVFIYLQSSIECVLFNLSVYWKSQVNSASFASTLFSDRSRHDESKI